MNRAPVQRRILQWFAANQRDLPWRRTRDPYKTLVAEVMLQQTQVSRVEEPYRRFLKRFPSVARLAAASPADVIRQWRGLGYNRRALALHRSARVIAANGFPADLRTLPGVGEYTAAAVACFAFGEHVAVVDTNVRRVLARLEYGKDVPAPTGKQLQELADRWLPKRNAYEWNQALMDLGAVYCRASNPRCADCPVKTACRYDPAGKPVTRRTQPRFEGSSRQRRGRILDQLRAGPATPASLGGGDAAIAAALESLQRDGLIERKGLQMRLPQ